MTIFVEHVGIISRNDPNPNPNPNPIHENNTKSPNPNPNFTRWSQCTRKA